jgi:transcriptional regulator with XRE-family HTH domain
MSQDHLASQIGVGRSAIQAIEGGGRRIRLGEACQIAQILGVSLDDLISDRPISVRATTFAKDAQ